ncbi:MAG: nicotinamide-nucleotide amidohydrolase family protein, partial [Methanomassiliicoccaceae archaeon]|nr:nicotinamide-nucleotide amidohydrolase family protein [Methanomassiliicoccaceae archaeon]
EFFMGSAVTYSNDSKNRILNVSRATLEKFGAVSAETAKEMALSAKMTFGTDIAASATGIAGPGGGTAAKPVGTVFIAVTDGVTTECKALALRGSRSDIRKATAANVIRSLTDLVTGE